MGQSFDYIPKIARLSPRPLNQPTNQPIKISFSIKSNAWLVPFIPGQTIFHRNLNAHALPGEVAFPGEVEVRGAADQLVLPSAEDELKDLAKHSVGGRSHREQRFSSSSWSEMIAEQYDPSHLRMGDAGGQHSRSSLGAGVADLERAY